MRIYLVAIAAALIIAAPTRVTAQCKPDTEKQIIEVKNTWVRDWNAKNLDGVVNLYAPDATLLPADGSRISGQQQIRAYFEKQIGPKVAVQSVSLGCTDQLAYDSGTYASDSGGVALGPGVAVGPGVAIGGGKHTEGNYLVVLKHEAGKWLIVQHASTARP